MFSNNSKHSIVSRVMWVGLMIFLAMASFLTLRYDNLGWLIMSGIFYAYASIYIVAILFGIRANIDGLTKSGPLLLLMALSILWLVLQTHIPANHSILNLSNSLPAPSWFAPKLVLSVDPVKTRWLAASNLFVYLFFILLLLQLTSRSRVKQLLFVLCCVGGIHACIGLVDYYAELQLVRGRQIDGHFDVARGLFVNRNHFAAFLVICLAGPIALGARRVLSTQRIHRSTSTFHGYAKSLLIIIMVVAVLAIVLSQSRAGAGSLLLTSMIAASVALMSWQQWRISWSKIIFSSIGLAALAVFILNSSLGTRILSDGFSLGERELQWRLSWGLIKQAPLAGFGGGSYGTVFQWMRDHQPLRDVFYNQSHSEYLHIWVEQGLLGLTIWIALLACVFFQAFKRFHVSPSGLERAICLAVIVSLGAAILQAGVDFNLQVVNIRLYFFAIIAALVAIPTIQKR